jgi:hypothetical protein
MRCDGAGPDSASPQPVMARASSLRTAISHHPRRDVLTSRKRTIDQVEATSATTRQRRQPDRQQPRQRCSDTGGQRTLLQRGMS